MSAGGRNQTQKTSTKNLRSSSKKQDTVDPAADLTPDLSEDSMAMSPAVVSNNNQRELRAIIASLQTKVESLSNKVDKLDTHVVSLTKALIVSESALAVSKMTSSRLKNELDRQEQYSRRNCIVMDGVDASWKDGPNEHTTKAKKILTDSFPTDEEITTGFDKAHPIGPVINGKQSYIMRFNKHSVVSRIYKNRGSLKQGITARPSLTKTRASTLRTCQHSAESISSVKFIFSDIEGNLKVCFVNQNLKGRSIHSFETEEDFRDLILDHEHSTDFPFSEDPPVHLIDATKPNQPTNQ